MCSERPSCTTVVRCCRTQCAHATCSRLRLKYCCARADVTPLVRLRRVVRSLAAGAMIYVVCDSLVPEMQAHGNKGLAMQGLMLGFVIMMILDVALG